MAVLIVCNNCGTEKESRYITTKFCSDKCRNSFRRKVFMYKLQCARCNNDFEAVKEHTKYCSDDCRKKPDHEKVKGKYHSAVTKVNKRCVICSGEFIVNQSSTRDCCSYECSYAFKVKQRPIHNAKCKECSQWFSSTYSNKRFCSSDCSSKFGNRTKETTRRKRMKENGRIDWDISIERLLKRDGSKCYLCEEQTLLNVDTNDNLYPSIEHVKPVAKGGTHTWDNVKIAHRICNSIKSDK